MAAFSGGKLKLLKKKMVNWAKEKKKKDEEAPRHIEEALAKLEDSVGGAYVSMEAKEQVIKLEVDHLRVLKDRE